MALTVEPEYESDHQLLPSLCKPLSGRGGRFLPRPGYSALSLAGVLVHYPFPGFPHLAAHLLDAFGDSPAPSVVTGAIVYALVVGYEGLQRDRRRPGGAALVWDLHLRARERGFQRLPAHLRVPGSAGVHIVD